MKELKLLEKIHKMCMQSLNPEEYNSWEEIKKTLIERRDGLPNIKWEFVDWVEKATGEAELKGIDKDGKEYEATGVMSCGEIVSVYDIKEYLEDSWDNYEPAPLEYFHSLLIKKFHEFRKERTESINVEINGVELNDMIAKSKVSTKRKYPDYIVRHNSIPKSEM